MKKQEAIEMLQNIVSNLGVTQIPIASVIDYISKIDVIHEQPEVKEVVTDTQVQTKKIDSQSIIKLVEKLQKELKTNIEYAIDNGKYDSVDKSTAEFSIGYRNVIELESVEVDLDEMNNDLKREVDTTIENFMDELHDYLNPEDEEEENYLQIPTQQVQ